MNKNKLNVLLPGTWAERFFNVLAAHPYLSALLVCLLINPFYLGAAENVPSNALFLESILVLIAGGLLLLRAKRCGVISKRIAPFLLALLPVLICIGAALYTRSQRKGIWLIAGGCVILLLLYGLIFHHKQIRTQATALLILGISFLLKYCYVFYTSVYTRQHDVGTFGSDAGHANYIEYFLFQHHLPDFDPRERWQFYHPPLHHMISAVWIWLSETIFGVGHDPARESIQTLTLFYAMAIVITGYRILRHFRLKGMSLYAPLLLIAFHPAYILFSGSINNDVLSVVFIMGATLCTLRWYDDPSWGETIKLALCIGLGMMTKMSVGLIAIPIGIVMLVKFVQMLKAREWRFLGKLGVFAAVCAPLGLWSPVRNLIRFGVPLNYVQKMSTGMSQYLGDVSLWERATDFSSKQFQSVFKQFASLETDNAYNEFNPLTALLKDALFGEYIRETNFSGHPMVLELAKVFFWFGVILAATAFVCMLVLMFRKLLHPMHKVYFGVFWLTMMISFYQLAGNYPFVCSMNSRYITPLIFIGAFFYGMMMQKMQENNKAGSGTLVKTMAILPILFAVMTTVIYMCVCIP